MIEKLARVFNNPDNLTLKTIELDKGCSVTVPALDYEKSTSQILTLISEEIEKVENPHDEKLSHHTWQGQILSLLKGYQ